MEAFFLVYPWSSLPLFIFREKLSVVCLVRG